MYEAELFRNADDDNRKETCSIVILGVALITRFDGSDHGKASSR